jgi:hypothetical protein
MVRMSLLVAGSRIEVLWPVSRSLEPQQPQDEHPDPARRFGTLLAFGLSFVTTGYVIVKSRVSAAVLREFHASVARAQHAELISLWVCHDDPRH